MLGISFANKFVGITCYVRNNRRMDMSLKEQENGYEP